MRIEQILTGNSPTFKQFRHHVVLLVAAFFVLVAGAVVLAPAAGADMLESDSDAVKAMKIILSGRLTSRYGMVGDPFNKGEMRMHNGVDVAAAKGTPIFAPAAGVVVVASDLFDGKPAYGKVVVIKTRNGVRVLFAHLDDYSVVVGQRVENGALLATVGNSGKSTGTHVHIETFRSGERVDPLAVLPLSAPDQI